MISPFSRYGSDASEASAPDRSLGRAGLRSPRVGVPARPFPQTLRALYERYRRCEAQELLALIPREGLRSIWRHRRAETRHEPPREGASLEELREVTEELLPLPPYEVWVRSYLSDRRPYLQRMGIPAAPARPDPVTVSTREMRDEIWAHLHLRRSDRGWVGFMSFHGPATNSSHRTGEIFRGDGPDEILDRFHEFTRPTLEAFFRSVAG
ncbi:MAG: hypothetical protein EA351_09785 [Gemmatimonadales bacterium]|nr:MAG: hypothetical protein EA351_09785 [Gemmatimonadales bacterium]